MKPTFKFFIGTLLAVFILQSCGTSKFGKAHYKHRDWVWVGNDEKEQLTVNETEKTEDVKEEPVQKIQLRKPEKPAVYTNPVVAEEKKTANTITENTVAEKHISDEIKSEEQGTQNNHVVVVGKENEEDIKDEQAADADTMFILMLVLSLFLPPLAVYLKDGGITGLFWLTLILCLLGGGLIFGYGYLASGWFIAFILALLRVLDVI